MVNSEIYLPGTSPKGEFSKYTNEIEKFFKSKKKWGYRKFRDIC